jgi:hypothetical protein
MAAARHRDTAAAGPRALFNAAIEIKSPRLARRRDGNGPGKRQGTCFADCTFHFHGSSSLSFIGE